MKCFSNLGDKPTLLSGHFCRISVLKNTLWKISPREDESRGKMKPDPSSCPSLCRSGLYFPKEDGTFLALGVNIIAQRKYEKEISNFTGTSKPNSTDEVSLGNSENSIVLGVSKPGLDSWSSYIQA